MKNKTLMSFLIIAMATTVFSSCKSNKETVVKGSSISFIEIKTGQNSGYSKFTTIEIHNVKELSEVWVNLFAKYDRKPPIPTIDFEKKMLIAVALGERNNGSYSIKIESILETKNGITVITEENKPGNTCNSTSVMVYPFQLIEISKTTNPITFTKIIKTNECGKEF